LYGALVTVPCMHTLVIVNAKRADARSIRSCLQLLSVSGRTLWNIPTVPIAVRIHIHSQRTWCSVTLTHGG
jgi:hypothetical protein